MAQNRIRPITLASIASSSVTSSYQAINSTGLPGSCFLIRIMNGSNQSITLSFNGVDDHEVVLASSTLQLDFQNNAQPSGYVALLNKGATIYIKGTAGTGTVYLSGYYVTQ